MFLGYTEVNYKFVDVSIVRRLKINKFLIKNSYAISKLNLTIFFWFRRLNEFELEFVKAFNHLLLFWLITGNLLYVDKFNSRLIKGMRYYRFIYKTSDQIDNIFKILDFFINVYLRSVKKKSLRLLDKNLNKHLFVLFDLNPFSNMRISNYLYLPTITDRFYLKFDNKSLSVPINRELNMYKFNW